MARPQGSRNKTTNEARKLLNEVLEGEIGHVQDALEQVRKDSPAKYLDVVCKLLPYWIPKQMNVHHDEPREMNLPDWIQEL